MHLLRRACALCLLLTALGPAVARSAETAPAGAEAGFVASLTLDEQAAAGLDRLTVEQRATLDQLVRRETRLARQGDVIAFAGTFSTRRPASEFEAAGLATLTPREVQVLDEAVARLLAQRPVTPGPRTEPGGAIETVTRRAQWHGEITAMYGRSSGGREIYGGSVTTIYDDPDRGFSAALTLGNYRGGTGYFFGAPYGYGYGALCPPGVYPGWGPGRRR